MLVKKKFKKEYYIFIILLIISILLNFFQFSSYKKETKRLSKGWEEAERILDEDKRANDSAYFVSLNELKVQIKELDSIRVADRKKFTLQISQLKSKYDKEFIRVSNTTVDSTTVISSRHLSEEIDYSKFQGK